MTGVHARTGGEPGKKLGCFLLCECFVKGTEQKVKWSEVVSEARRRESCQSRVTSGFSTDNNEFEICG